VVIPGCSAAKPEKKWPPERYAELADMMRNAGHQVVIIGTNTDRVTADDVLRGAPFCTDMVGKTDLVTLARTLQSAAMVVGNDTGPTFMAARLGAPTVMVMGPQTNPEMSAPTGRRCDWVRADAIDTINADTVMAAVTALR
jgi:ADP-heptose:LPS heptosyltransferase